MPYPGSPYRMAPHSAAQKQVEAQFPVQRPQQDEFTSYAMMPHVQIVPDFVSGSVPKVDFGYGNDGLRYAISATSPRSDSRLSLRQNTSNNLVEAHFPVQRTQQDKIPACDMMPHLQIMSSLASPQADFGSGSEGLRYATSATSPRSDSCLSVCQHTSDNSVAAAHAAIGTINLDTNVLALSVAEPDPEAVPMPFGFKSPSASELEHTDEDAILDSYHNRGDHACESSDSCTTTTQHGGTRDVSLKSRAKSSVTTLMIRNIPCCVTQQQLIDIIDSLGFAQQYDYVYLPTPSHLGNSHNLGYGFVNFKEPSDAFRFANTFTCYKFEDTLSRKACEVRPARIQGLERNFRNIIRTLNKTVPTGARTLREGPLIRFAEPMPLRSSLD